MEILTSQLPSGGYGYEFPSITVKPFNFLEICNYVENVPESDPLGRYLFDIKQLIADDPNIANCYIMDLDFLIFYKKLNTVSGDLKYNISIKCSECGDELKKTIYFNKDIKFKQIDTRVMEGAVVEINNHKYDIRVPTVDQFMKVFEVYLRYRKVTDLKMIKTIALVDNFELQGNQIEKDILEAKHSDITLLLALRNLYYDRLEPVELYCPKCNKGLKNEERRSMAVSVETLIVDFFREICINSPIDGTKVLFK